MEKLLNSINNKYKYLLDTKNPDKHIEYFWYGFRASIPNFFKHYNLNFTLPVDTWSKHLNDLQKDKKYLEIEKSIRFYMERFGWYVIMYGCYYNTNIFYSNIKRWNKISNKYNLNIEKYPSFFNVYFNIFHNLIKKKQKFKDKPHLIKMLSIVRKYIDCYDGNEDDEINNIKNLYQLLDQALKHKEEAIIDHIANICDIWTYINSKYKLNIIPGTKARKILLKYAKK